MIHISYKFNSLKKGLKAIQVSTKVCIRMNESGILSLQFMIPTDEKQVHFLEFLVSIHSWINILVFANGRG